LRNSECDATPRTRHAFDSFPCLSGLVSKDLPSRASWPRDRKNRPADFDNPSAEHHSRSADRDKPAAGRASRSADCNISPVGSGNDAADLGNQPTSPSDPSSTPAHLPKVTDALSDMTFALPSRPSGW
jgi:hypothetical protein